MNKHGCARVKEEPTFNKNMNKTIDMADTISKNIYLQWINHILIKYEKQKWAVNGTFTSSLY